jgi:hypothetical protein
MNAMILLVHIVHLIVETRMVILIVHVHRVLASTKRQKHVEE